MAVLEKLRSRSGLLIAFITGLALLLFVLDDLMRSGKSLLKGNVTDIAVIGGEAIPVAVYEAEVEQLIKNYEQNTGNTTIDELTMNQIRQSVWQEITDNAILNQQAQKAGINVSPEELFDMVQGANPHPMVRQAFTNRETGIFDKANLLSFLKNMDEYATEEQRNFWYQLEERIEKERKMMKYMNLIRKGIYITKIQAERRFIENNHTLSAEFIKLPFDQIADSTIRLSILDKKKFYKEHINEFKQPSTRDLAFVSFPIQPSAEDDTAAKQWIYKNLEEFSTTKEAIAFVNLNSDSAFKDKYYKKGELPGLLDSVLFESKKGTVYGPYRVDMSYRIARLERIEMLPDSVRARHILIRPDERVNDEQAKARADSILNVIKAGGDFAAHALQFSADGSAQKGGDLGWFKDGMMVKPFNDSCFFGKTNDLKLVKTQFGYHIIEITGQSPRVKKVQVAVLYRLIQPSTKTYQEIYSRASQFAGVNNTLDKFLQAAQNQNLQVTDASNVYDFQRELPGLNSAREIVRWAFKAQKGDVSIAIETDGQFIVAALKTIRKKGYAPLEQVNNQITFQVMLDKKAELLTQKINDAMAGAKTIADIAAKLGVQPVSATNLSFSSYSIPGGGFDPLFPAILSRYEPNVITTPIRGQSGVFVAMVTSKNTPEIPADLEINKITLRGEVESRQQYLVWEALRELSDITDNRALFY